MDRWTHGRQVASKIREQLIMLNVLETPWNADALQVPFSQ
jgi:hypothetical protein